MDCHLGVVRTDFYPSVLVFVMVVNGRGQQHVSVASNLSDGLRANLHQLKTPARELLENHNSEKDTAATQI